jgi:hypothetical protein
MRELRAALARGGVPRLERRTAHDWARIAAYHTIAELMRLLDHFKRRVEQGEPCRLVYLEKPHEPGRLQVEIVIEVVDSAPLAQGGMP